MRAISEAKIVLVFFDTNVLVYCTDSSAEKKQATARALVSKASESGKAVLSTQVLIELFNIVTRKQSMPTENAQALILAYTLWPVVQSDAQLVTEAIAKTIKYQLSIWDAMVVEAALRADANVLYTEDLQHGQRFDGLTVVNPFV
jgi:predicted nucleic acid-binding protein